MHKILLTSIFLTCLISSIAYALPVNNLSFETQLNGWNYYGNANTINSFTTLNNGVLNATDGNTFLELNSSGDYSTQNYGGTSGSLLETEINLLAGDKFSFDWAFSTTDYAPYNDFSLFIGESDNLLANVALTGNFGSTGWNSYEWMLTENYQGNIAFMVSDSVDTIVQSSLLIDNIQIESTSVPEPGVPFLLALGYIGIYFSRKEIRPPSSG